MKYLKSFFLLLSLFFVTAVFAALEFHHNKFGVRANGLGGAYSAIAEGPDAIFYNWARPTETSGFAFRAESGSTLGTPFLTFSAQNMFDRPEFRAGMLYSSISGIPETTLDSLGQPSLTGRTFGSSSISGYFSYQTQWLGINTGFMTSTFLESLNAETAKTISLSAAAYKQIKSGDVFLNFGAAIKHLAALPLQWSTGEQEKLSPMLLLATDVELPYPSAHLAAEIELEKYFPPKLYLGGEYWFTGASYTTSAVAIRGGFRNGALSLGTGLNFKEFSIDYAFVKPKKDQFEIEHRFSFGWGGYRKADIPMDIRPQAKPKPPLKSLKIKSMTAFSTGKTSDVFKELDDIKSQDTFKTIQLASLEASLENELQTTAFKQTETDDLLSVYSVKDELSVTEPPQLEKREKTDNNQVLELTLKFEGDSQIVATIFDYAIDAPLQINARRLDNLSSTVSLPLSIKESLPINLMVFPPDKSSIILLDISLLFDTTLLISGTLPKGFNLIVNNTAVTLTNEEFSIEGDSSKDLNLVITKPREN